MRNASSAFKQAIADGRMDYTLRVVLTLADETSLTLTNEDIWENGLVIEDAVSGDNEFQLGAAIINQCKITLNNIYETYSTYDFYGATAIVYVGFADLNDGTGEELLMGHYTVNDTSYNGSTITLTCLDNMFRFDKAYDSTLAYPATLGQIVQDACTNCGVTLDTDYLHFANYEYSVSNRPAGDATTYRQVIAWAAQIAGCFARINSNGNLEIKFFNTNLLASYSTEALDGGYFDNGSPSYTSGDTADGGTFNPWSTATTYDGGTLTALADVHMISEDFSATIATDDVVITGVKVVVNVTAETISQYASAYSSASTYVVGSKVTYENQLYECTTAISTPEEWNSAHWKDVGQVEYTAGTSGYTISVENNALVTGGSAAQTLATYLGGVLIGMRFRTGTITHPSDPTIEAGDIFVYTNRKAQSFAMIVSSTTFSSAANQNTASSAASPQRNSAQRFSEATRTYVELRKQIIAQKSYLETQLAAASGLYYTEVPDPPPSTASKIYYHNKAKLSESDIQMYFSTAGFMLSDNGGQSWYGMTVDGQMIAEILSATGINAEWIDIGTKLGGWEIGADELTGTRVYETSSGEQTESLVHLKPPSPTGGSTTVSFYIEPGATGTVEVRFGYKWSGGGAKTVSMHWGSNAYTQAFSYSLWWRENDGTAHEEQSSGTATSFTTTAGSSSATGDITVGVVISVSASSLSVGTNYPMVCEVGDLTPYDTSVNENGRIRSPIPTDSIPADSTLDIVDGNGNPQFYIDSSGNILSGVIKAEGLTELYEIEDYNDAVPPPNGGIKLYQAKYNAVNGPGSDAGVYLYLLAIGGSSMIPNMQIAFGAYANTDTQEVESRIYTRMVSSSWNTFYPWHSSIDLAHPVGSIFITDTNTNPGTYLGGTWTLVKKGFKVQDVTDAVTWSTTNVVSGSGQSVFFLRDERISFRLRFTNKVAIGDSTLTMGTITPSKIGLSGCYYISMIASDDVANKAIMMDVQTVNSAFDIRTIDVVNGGTISASTTTNPEITVCGEMLFGQTSMVDSMCDKFYWQRTA